MKRRTLGLVVWSLAASVPALAQEPAAPPPDAVPPPPTAAATPSPAAPAAAASEPAAFGAVGEIAISVDIPFNNESPELAFIHSSTTMGGGSSNTFAIQPSIDYFVAPNVSVGALVGYDYSSETPSGGGGSLTTNGFAAEVRVGYNVPLADVASIWPRVGIGYTHQSTSSGGNSTSGYSIPLVAFVPVLWHPFHHFFLGGGPVFTTELVNKVESQSQPKTTDYGVQALIGGYLGGP